MIQLSNEYLNVHIDSKGAELKSVVNKQQEVEYLWQGTPTSVVLFPVFQLKGPTLYQYEQKDYQLDYLGIAYQKDFTIQYVSDTSATFYLKSNEETLKDYPFEFSLQVSYVLFENQLTISYEIYNTSLTKPMYYQLASQSRLAISDCSLEDLSITFDPATKYLRLPLSRKSQIQKQQAYYESIDEVEFKPPLFKRGPLLYKIPERTRLLLTKFANHHIELRINNFPYLSLYLPEKQDYLSIQASSLLINHRPLQLKESLAALGPNEIQAYDYSVIFT